MVRMPRVICTELAACCGVFCLLSPSLLSAITPQSHSVFFISAFPVLAQLALTLCIHPIVEHSQDGDAVVLLAGAVAAAIGAVFGKQQPRGLLSRSSRSLWFFPALAAWAQLITSSLFSHSRKS